LNAGRGERWSQAESKKRLSSVWTSIFPSLWGGRRSSVLLGLLKFKRDDGGRSDRWKLSEAAGKETFFCRKKGSAVKIVPPSLQQEGEPCRAHSFPEEKEKEGRRFADYVGTACQPRARETECSALGGIPALRAISERFSYHTSQEAGRCRTFFRRGGTQPGKVPPYNPPFGTTIEGKKKKEIRWPKRRQKERRKRPGMSWEKKRRCSCGTCAAKDQLISWRRCWKKEASPASLAPHRWRRASIKWQPQPLRRNLGEKRENGLFRGKRFSTPGYKLSLHRRRKRGLSKRAQKKVRRGRHPSTLLPRRQVGTRRVSCAAPEG